MGGVISLVRSGVSAAVEGIKVLVDLNSSYQALLQRVASTPPLPVPNPTTSYWMEDAPHPHLDAPSDIQSYADVVIIGSGISGVAAAKTIFELSPTKSITVLEARGVCSGATGRNGGHIKAVPYVDFALHKQTLGEKGAKRIVEFQMRHLDTLKEAGSDIEEAEVREVETVDLFLDVEGFDKAKKAVRDMRKLMDVEVKVWEGEDIKRFEVSGCVGAISYRAGAMWPYRFVTGLWNNLLKEYSNLSLVTNTPATAVKTVPGGYEVTTPRGTIKTKQVLHATNGYAGRLLPQLKPSLASIKGHMTAQTPVSFPYKGQSWSVIYPRGFDYITQRENGDLLLGGGFARSKENGLDQVGVYDDSTLDIMTLMHVNGVAPTVFNTAVDVKNAWSGIMGYTGDSRPFVGRVNGEEWVSAGFCGHGMVWAWLCGVGVGVMMAGKEGEKLEKGVGRPEGKLEDWFPKDLLAVREADIKNLKDEMF